MNESTLCYEEHGKVALIRLCRPPVNSLGHPLRAALLDAVDRANRQDAVRAIVITGSAGMFSAGADISEFGTPKAAQEPRLGRLILALEDSLKPVIAAISGTCLGGGLELALGAHFRVAAPDARLGLPEVRLGLIPGAGGTQRLPRLTGLERALNMILSGNDVPAEQLQGTGLIDAIAGGDVAQAGIDFARRAVAESMPMRKTRDIAISDPTAEAFLGYALASVATGKDKALLPARKKCVEAISAAVSLPFEQGIALEREKFHLLMQSGEARALRYIFKAERAAGKLDDPPSSSAVHPISNIGIVGAGTMGTGIAISVLDGGMPVTLLEMDQAALDRGVGRIRKHYELAVKKGKLSTASAEQRLSLLTPALDYAGLSAADLIIEAVFEDMDVKKQVFRQLDQACKPEAILATNTSYLDVNRIAQATGRPANVLGLHFFSPANIMRLLEVVRGEASSRETLAACLAMARRIGKKAVLAGVCDGFIGNRMLARYSAAAHQLVAEGATPRQVDAALTGFGLAMGPFQMSDLAGLDIGYAARMRRKKENPESGRPHIADELVARGHLGQKTGSGWYRYEEGDRSPKPFPLADEIIDEYRSSQGIVPRKISQTEIVERCIYALVNEGARILEEGIAARAGDIDVVYLNGYGFPRRFGGPMFYADEVGLKHVHDALHAYAAAPGAEDWWQPAPLLRTLAESGATFEKWKN